jgi:hypothetical protein
MSAKGGKTKRQRQTDGKEEMSDVSGRALTHWEKVKAIK